ncbi:MAG: hypothetical protein V4597_19465 [Pseudomonadota bacterium]
MAQDTLPDLTHGERLLLFGFRALAYELGACPLVRRAFHQACGAAGAETLNALEVFVRELARHGRRRVTLGVPGSLPLSRDEQLILALFAAAQAEDYPRLEAHLAWLLADPPRPPFAAAACLVAQAFSFNGLVLRVPDMAPGPEARETSEVVVPFRRRAAV